MLRRRPGSARATGFEPGLKSGTELMALYVPCATLAAAGRAMRVAAEWVAIEKEHRHLSE